MAKEPSLIDQVIQRVEHYSPWESTVDPNAAPPPAKGTKKKPPPPPQATTPGTTPTTTPAAQVPAGGSGSPDLAALAGNNPALAAAIQQANSGAYANTTVSYWPGLGVDPQAPVLGLKPTGAGNLTAPGEPNAPLGGLGPQTAPVTQTASAWLKNLYTMAPAEIANLQQRMYAQGWYAGTGITQPNQIQYGRPDAATLQAYGSALAETARYNLAGQRVGIDGVISLGGPNAKANSASNANYFFPEYNPADVKTGFQNTAQSVIGHEDSGQLPQFQAAFTAAEQAASAGKDIAKAESSGQYESKPNPTSFATQYLINNDPSEVAAYGAASRMLELQSMLGVK